MGQGQGDTTVERKAQKVTLMFVTILKDKPQSLWDNVLWTDETKAELFENEVHQFVYR